MQAQNTQKIQQGWVSFLRIYCKNGYIDKWIGDGANNPNNLTKSNYQLNSIAIYYRLHNTKEWVSTLRSKGEELYIFRSTCTANEIWDTYFQPEIDYLESISKYE